MANFVDRLRTIRSSKRETQKQVAEAIGTSEQNYQRYERGSQQPTLPVISLLADHFQVSLDYLAGRSEYSYYVITETKDGHITYGIRLRGPDHREKAIPDISVDPFAILDLIDLLSRNNVSPSSLADVVEAFAWGNNKE